MFVTIGLSNEVCNCIGVEEVTDDKKLNCPAKLALGLITGDAFLFVTTLVIGILGILGIIPGIPPAAAYSLVAVSGAIFLSWLILTIASKGDNVQMAKKLFQAASSSNPKLP